MLNSHLSVYVDKVLLSTEAREEEKQDNNVEKTSGAECKNLSFTVVV